MDKINHKILLISFYNDEAYGLRQLHSILHYYGYDVRILFVKIKSEKVDQRLKMKSSFTNVANPLTDKEEDILADFITELNPDMIGFSLVSSNFTLYKRIYQRIRNLGNFKIIVGGWQASLNPEECIHYCDMLCIGEAEEALPELADRLFHNRPINDSKNFWIRQGGQIIKNPPRPLSTALSSYPIPVFDNELSCYIEDDKLIHKDPYMENTRYGTMVARGCPYSCTYCSNSFMAKNVYPGTWSKIRYRSVDHVMLELNEAKKKLPKISRINFYDELFSPKKEWLKGFRKRYAKEIQLPFYCMFYPGTCSEEMAKLLKDSMLDGVWLGIQSGSPRVRREVFKRYYTNAVIKKQAEIFHKYDISIRYDFILDNPFETFEESLESINLLLELPEPFSVNLFSLKFFPRTEITSMALKAGVIQEKDLDDHLIMDHHNYLVSKNSGNSDNDFINHLAAYISFLALESRVKKEKKKIKEIIYAYRFSKDINPVKKLLEPFI